MTASLFSCASIHIATGKDIIMISKKDRDSVCGRKSWQSYNKTAETFGRRADEEANG